MPDTIRQRIVDAIQSAARGISVANGYKTDFGGRAHLWKVTPYEDAGLPCLNIFDRKREIERHLSGRHHHQLLVEIVVVALGTATDRDLRAMMADVIRMVGQNRKWGGLAYDTDPVSDEIAIEQEDRKRGGAKLAFLIHFRTEPYNEDLGTN